MPQALWQCPLWPEIVALLVPKPLPAYQYLLPGSQWLQLQSQTIVLKFHSSFCCCLICGLSMFIFPFSPLQYSPPQTFFCVFTTTKAIIPFYSFPQAPTGSNNTLTLYLASFQCSEWHPSDLNGFLLSHWHSLTYFWISAWCTNREYKMHFSCHKELVRIMFLLYFLPSTSLWGILCSATYFHSVSISAT